MRFNKETVNMKTILYAGIVGVVLLVIIIASFTSKGSKLEKKNIAFERKAEEHLYLGEYDKAIEEYTKINTNKEKDNKLLALKNIDIANAHFLKGDVENYKKYVQLTKDLKVQDEDIVNKIVFYEYINGDGSQALKDGEEALKANSKNKSLVKSMVAIYMANNKTDKVKELIKLYGVDKNSAYDIAEYSRLLMMSGDMKGGFTKLKEAWNLDKDEYKIYDVLAQESAYDLEKVISSIKELQKNDPNDIAYKVWLAKVYSLSPEKAKEGLQILEQLKSKNVGNIEIKLIEASILQNMNKHKESDRLINEVIQSNKDDYKALHTAGWFYLNKHDLEKAMEYCKRSIEQNKNYPDNYAFLMPEILKSMDKASLAKTYFMTALEKEPYNYNILENAASFYWDADENLHKALDYYKLASAIKPQEPEIKYDMALLYYNDSKDEEAIKTLQECIALRNDVIKYHRTLGTIYLTSGKHEEGIKEIRAAFKLDENDILTLNNAGCYYAIYTNDLHRGYYNLQEAIAGISEDTDEYTKKVIKENYNKMKLIIDKIEKGKANESIKVPDFRLLY